MKWITGSKNYETENTFSKIKHLANSLLSLLFYIAEKIPKQKSLKKDLHIEYMRYLMYKVYKNIIFLFQNLMNHLFRVYSSLNHPVTKDVDLFNQLYIDMKPLLLVV